MTRGSPPKKDAPLSAGIENHGHFAQIAVKILAQATLEKNREVGR